MENTEQQPDNTGENRDENGRFNPGISGNPSGRPKGSVSIRDSVRQELVKVPEGEKETYLELLVKQILTKAIKGDSQTLRLIWEQLEGRAKQSTEIDESRPSPTPILVKFLDAKSNNNEMPIFGGLSCSRPNHEGE